MLNKLNKFKIIILFTLILLFILFFNNNVNAIVSSDISTLTDIQKETISKTWNSAVEYCKKKNINIDDSYYFITYSNGSSNYCAVYILNPKKNTLRELATEAGKKDHFNYFLFFDCKVGEEPVGRWDGYNNNNTIIASYYFSGDYNYVIANNIETTDSSYKEISRSYKDVSFLSSDLFPGLSIEYYEPYSMYYVFTDWYDVREISLDNSYAYGKYTDYNPDDDSQWIWYDMVYEYKENEEGKKTITREGFPLNMYGYYSFLMENLKTKEWVIKGLDFSKDALVGTEYENCLDPLENLNLYLYETMANPTVYSNYINKDLLDKCKLVDFSVSFDNGESFSSINIDCKEEFIVNGITYIRFYYTLYANDIYTFKLRIFDEDYNEYEVIKTFSLNSYDNIIDFDGTETTSASPFITAFADSNIIRFSTQTFKERISLNYFEDLSADTLRYTAYYIDEEAYQVFGDNYEDWILMDVCYEDYDKITQGYPYYFKTEFSFDSLEDGDIFYFVFFDNKLGCFSQVTTYTLESKSDLYTISQNITFNNDKFQRLYSFFNEHFGFLTYPFEFIINLLTRIFNINYEEPVLHFPQIINPLDDTVIFNGFDYNLNSILEYDGIAYFYNIYLIAVDCIFIVAFLFGCKHTIEEVFGNG